MRDEELDRSERDLQLPQPNGSAAAAVKKQLLAAGFYKGAGPKAVREGVGSRSTKQCHPEIGDRRFSGSCKSNRAGYQQQAE